jgi:hypothetical protein
MDANGEIHVCTLRGARIATLQQTFSTMETSPAVKKVVLHVGTNNIAGRQADCVQDCVNQYRGLLDTVREKLPEAKVAVSALPPLKPWVRSKTAHQLNLELSKLCHQKRVTFLRHDALWTIDDEDKLNPQILNDRVHLSNYGLALLLRDTKKFLSSANVSSNRELIDSKSCQSRR